MGFFLCLSLSQEYCYLSKVIYSFNCPRIFTSLSISTVSLCQTVMVNKYQAKKIFQNHSNLNLCSCIILPAEIVYNNMFNFFVANSEQIKNKKNRNKM